ncbi:MAG: FliA/WhiG family RNA polymerase sigma factor [Candidatus Eisenbacteria bacterium]|uniref:FliA/WhiG family RNA polymerase sigma factor n=1 Tax=Eiseniibacteriota bacterium TaxID=2212470 RepID=A0A538U4Z6_UNCEI|nr:MAG: FliA/WhiG family RNA polymerase sigma factor [Candidatus Eisenbacteria bacterium]
MAVSTIRSGGSRPLDLSTQPPDGLWLRFRKLGDDTARTELLDRHLGLVRHTAHKLLRSGARGLSLEDLMGAGTLGLTQALDGFDVTRGLAFSTYAIPRIRGAMLDEMNRQQWAPRSVRSRRRLIARTRAALQQCLRRDPTQAEMARALEVDLPTYWRWIHEVEGRTLVALDLTRPENEDEAGLHETIPDGNAAAPGDDVAQRELLEELREGLRSLPARDRMVLTLYYFEKLMLREIGAVLGVSESRVSQLHGRALARLRAKVSR